MHQVLVRRTTFSQNIHADACMQANDHVGRLQWVTSVDVTMDAQAPQVAAPQADRPGGLRNVAHIIAVSSCKGGVVLP